MSTSDIGVKLIELENIILRASPTGTHYKKNKKKLLAQINFVSSKKSRQKLRNFHRSPLADVNYCNNFHRFRQPMKISLISIGQMKNR
jgi:hypothetical protein